MRFRPSRTADIKQSQARDGRTDAVSWIRAQYSRHRQFVLYCLIGAVGVTIDYVSYALMVRYLGVHYVFANCISVFLGISNNFLMNALINFKAKDFFLLRYLSFAVVGLLGLALSSGLLYLLVTVLSVNTYISKVITIPVVTVFQYALNRKITFRKAGA